MDEPELNREELLATLEWVEAHREVLDMGHFIDIDDYDVDTVCMADAEGCGTTACFAGWHVLRRGMCLSRQAKVVTPEGRTVLAGGTPVGAGHWAWKDLGLTEVEMTLLFFDTDETGLRRVVEGIMDGRYRE